MPSTHPLVATLVEVARAADPRPRGRSGGMAPRMRSRSCEAGVPAVEFGPVGAGHHGPDEYVEIASLQPYREALVAFVRAVAAPGPPAAVGG